MLYDNGVKCIIEIVEREIVALFNPRSELTTGKPEVGRSAGGVRGMVPRESLESESE